jgi:tetratricopeptide (TPR) repeat protein
MAETEFKYDVFISYSHKDEEWVVNTLLPALENAGLRVCIDYRDFDAGKPSIVNMEDAVDESHHTVLVLTPNWTGSEWTDFESILTQTDDPAGRRQKLIPIMLEKCTSPKRVKSLTYVDFMRSDRLDNAWAQLFKALGKPNAPIPNSSTPISNLPISPDPNSWYLAHPYPMPPNFTGRVTERKMLNNWLSEDKEHPLLILRALGGFGKSALAWHWLTHDVSAKQWPKVVWWSFYEGDASFENFLKDTLKYLGIANAEQITPREQVVLLLNLMRYPGIILILDGFERVLRAYGNMGAAYQSDELEKDQFDNSRDSISLFADVFLREMCAFGFLMNSKVLMTTRLTPRSVERYDQFLQGCCEQELRAMDKKDAVEFFHSLSIHGTHAEIEAACEPYAFHPLSLRILAGIITNDREKPGDISIARKLDITNNVIQNKHHILEMSYNSLTSAQKRLLGRIACFRAPMIYDALKNIHGSGKGSESFDESLRTLEKRGLLHWDKTANKYDLHPIVRRFAYDRLTAADRTGAHERLVNYFEAVPKPEKVEKLEDLAPVIELYHHMVRAGKLDEARQVFKDRLDTPTYYQFGAYQLQIELLQSLFLDGEDKPPRLETESAQAQILNDLASVYALSGQPRRAVQAFKVVIGIDEKNNDKSTSAAITLGNVAYMAQINIGALSEAERYLRRSIDLSREIKDESNEAIGHQQLGRVLSYRGAWQNAKQELTISTKYWEKTNDVQGICIGEVFRALRFLLMARADPQSSIVNLKSAIEAASRALELADETTRTRMNIPRDYIRAYWLLGTAYRANGELPLAEENLSKAISMCRQINDVAEEADILLDIAHLRYDQKNHEEAKSLAEEALTITERCGYVLQGADVNLFLAQFALEQEKDRVKAKEYAETALKLATCDGPPYYYKVAYEEAERFLENLK